MTTLSFFLILTTGFFTGLSHCVGMCGPLVSAFALRRRNTKREVSNPLLLFQLGRLTTYLCLGAILGAIGSLVLPSLSPDHVHHAHNPADPQSFVTILQSWQGGLSALLGLLILLMGLSLLGLIPIRHLVESATWGKKISGWLRYWLTSAHPAAPFSLGLVNGLLPCGAVYAASLLAAASGDMLKGASTMLVFGLGTLPAMLAVGYSTAWFSWRWRTDFFRVAAVLVMGVGLQLFLRGLASAGHLPHAMLGGVMLW